jgi:hypothetical protein
VYNVLEVRTVNTRQIEANEWRLLPRRPQRVSISSPKRSDTIAATLLADVDEAKAALQDISPVARVAHFTPEASSRCTPFNALELPRMLALVIVSQLGENVVETFPPLMRENIGWCISCHNFFRTLFDAIYVCSRTITMLPIHAADITELGATSASFRRSAKL